MSDLVERLRETAKAIIALYGNVANTCDEAADRIEELEADRNRLSVMCKTCYWWYNENREHREVAECWLNPPIVVDDTTTQGNTFSYKRPRTYKSEYCSFHKPISE